FKIAPIKNTDTSFKPKLFIEEVKVNGTTVQPGTGMELPYTQRNLTINMAAPSYADEQQVQYSYQLQGSGNNEWSEPSPNPDFNFLNLSPGKYTLNVKASFPSTDYAPSYLAYSFSIIPPYWQTNWFRVMAGIVWALNQKNDSLSDLLSYTRAYASEYLSQNGIHCSFHEPEQYPAKSVTGEFRRNIYLTVKEALHNIVKHAQASGVYITIITDHDLLINIHDNGTGFNENNIRPFSNGLGNMKTRMEGLGGS